MTNPGHQAGNTRRERQSTQEIVAEAGLAPSARTKRGSLAMILALGGLVVLGTGGILALGLLGRPATPTNRDSALIESGTPGTPEPLSPTEAARLRRALLEGEDEARRRKRRPSASARERELLAFYREDHKIEVRPVTGRGQQAARRPATVRLDTGEAAGVVPGGTGKYEARPGSPAAAPATGALGQDHIREVLGRSLKRIRRRLERLAGRDPRLHGKLVVELRVQPDGRVDRVQVRTPRFQATPVADALHEELGRLRFEPFPGPAQDVTIPLLIAPGS